MVKRKLVLVPRPSGRLPGDNAERSPSQPVPVPTAILSPDVCGGLMNFSSLYG